MLNETAPTPSRAFGKDILAYLPSKAVPALIGLIAIPIITRLFEPGDYGNYILVITTVGLLALIPGSLLGTAAVRFFAAYKKQSKLESFYNTLIKTTVACVAGIALVFFGVLQALRAAVPIELYHLMSIGILLFVLTSIFTIPLHVLNAKQKATLYSCFSIWQVGVGLAFGVAIVLTLKWGVDGLLWGSIGAIAIALPFLYHASFGKAAREGAFSKSIAIEMSKFGAPLIIGNLAAWILSLSDRYVIELYRGSYEVGLYSASYSISEQALTMLLSLFMLAGYPLIVNTWETGGKEATQEFVGKLTRYYLLIGLPAALGMSVLSKPIIVSFTGAAYHEGYRIISLVAFGTFLLGLQRCAQQGLLLYKRTNIIMYAAVSAGLLNLGLNFLLVPMYGYMAAAVTTLISYAFLLAVMVVISRRHFVWEFPFKSLGKAALASAVMGAIVYPIGNSLTSSTLVNLIAGICIGVIVYFAMLFLLREPKKEEIQELRAISRKILRRRD